MIKTNDSIGETPESNHGLGKFLGIGLVIWALWSFLTDKKPNKISIAGIKKRRSKRFFYMLDTPQGLKTASRSQVAVMKKELPESLYAIWAYDANEARALIKTGKGERYGQPKKLDFAGHLLNCIGWQQVVDKNGKNITRCFIMAPNCKTKTCIKETEERKAEGWKPKGRKQLQELTNIEGKKQPIGCGNWGLEKFGLICEKIGDEFHFKTDSGKVKWKIKDVNGTFRLYHRSKYGRAGFHAQGELAWANQKGLYSLTQYIIKHEIYEKGDSPQLQGVNLSCKQYIRDAYNKLRCKKYALTCASENECAAQKAPIPWKPIDVEYTPKAIRSVAKMLTQEMNQSLDDTKRVMRRIKYHGGIAPYSGGYLQEEYRDIPSKYKSKEGVKLDELAQEMEMNESELVEAINKAEEARSRLPKRKSRFSVKDMMFEAESYLAKQEGLSGLGKYKSWDEASTIKEAFRVLEKHPQLDRVYIVPTAWHGLVVDINEPPYGTNYIEVLTTGKVNEYLYTPRKGMVLQKSKEMTQDEKTKLQEQLVRLDSMVKEAKKAEHKIAEKGGQMTLFGKLHPYYFKDTGAKVFVSDDIKYHRGPAFKRADRYRVEILDEDKEHMGTMSTRQIEAQLTEIKPAIQQSLFGVRFKADTTANQIRSRIFDPKKIIKGTYFTRQSTTPGVSYVMGQNNKDGKFVTQSIRFDRSIFDTDRAKRWFNSNIKRIKDTDDKSYPYPKPYYIKTEGLGNSTAFSKLVGRKIAMQA